MLLDQRLYWQPGAADQGEAAITYREQANATARIRLSSFPNLLAIERFEAISRVSGSEGG